MYNFLGPHYWDYIYIYIYIYINIKDNVEIKFDSIESKYTFFVYSPLK